MISISVILTIGYFGESKKNSVSNRNSKMNPFYLLQICAEHWTFNFIGALTIAFFVAYLGETCTGSNERAYAFSVAKKKLSSSLGAVFLRAIGANWLVCLAIFMATGSSDVVSKILAIWFPIMGFTTMGLDHSIANMYIIPAALFVNRYNGGPSWWPAFFPHLIVTTIGNFIGGCVCVGCMYSFIHLHFDHSVKFHSIDRDISELPAHSSLSSESVASCTTLSPLTHATDMCDSKGSDSKTPLASA